MDNLTSFSCQHIRAIKMSFRGLTAGLLLGFYILDGEKKKKKEQGKWKNIGRKLCKPGRFPSTLELAVSRLPGWRPPGAVIDPMYLLAGPYFLATHPHPSKAPRANLLSVTANQLSGTSNRYHEPFTQALSVVRRDAIVPAVSASWLVRRRSWHLFRGNWACFRSRGCGRWGLQTKLFLGKVARNET